MLFSTLLLSAFSFCLPMFTGEPGPMIERTVAFVSRQIPAAVRMPSMGDSLGDIHLTEMISSSGQTRVFKSTVNGEVVAVKVFNPATPLTEIMKEKQVLDALGRTRGDLIHENGYYAISQQFFQGQTLEQAYYHDPKYATPEAQKLLEDKANAEIAKMHKAGYIHNDPHLGNFVVDDAGNVHVIDFGKSRLINDPLSPVPDYLIAADFPF